MATSSRFSKAVIDSIRDGKILGIRAGMGDHRIIGIWVVVVESRVFIRSWTLKPDGWYRTLLENPRGVIQVDGREIPIRAVHTRSERLKKAVDGAYAAKYHTPGALQYVKGFRTKRRRETTMELIPHRWPASRTSPGRDRNAAKRLAERARGQDRSDGQSRKPARQR